MPYSAAKIGNEFIRLAETDTPPRFLTPLQLMKLVYIAHGWSLHYRPAQPLLNEPAQAWQYGPVIPSLYQRVRSFGASPITSALSGDTDPQSLGDWDKSMIAAVYKAYKHLSGTQLSAMTHQQGTPWSDAWSKEGRNALIENQAIKTHYDWLAANRK